MKKPALILLILLLISCNHAQIVFDMVKGDAQKSNLLTQAPVLAKLNKKLGEITLSKPNGVEVGISTIPAVMK